MSWRNDGAGHRGSVQAALPLDAIRGDVVVLRDGSCRAVVETGFINFALRSEAEQEAILAGYRRLLNGLTSPVQVLVRVAPADVEGYLRELGGARQARLGEAGEHLIRDHEAFVRRMARERAPLARRCFWVLTAETRTGPRGSGAFRPWRRGGGEGQRTDPFAVASRVLTARCDELTQALAGIGIRARRLAGDEIAALWREVIAGAARPGAAAHGTAATGGRRA